MNTSSSTFQNGLNLHLLGFALPKEIIKDNQEIRVSITSIPDGIKQHFTLFGKDMYHSNHVFSLDITNKTQKFIIVFRRVSVIEENPIIASSMIHLYDFNNVPNVQLNMEVITTDIKYINIFYPLQKQMSEEHKKSVQRKVVGQMQVQLTFTGPFSMAESKNTKSSKKLHQNNENLSCFHNESKAYKSNSKKRGDEYEKLINDNY